MPAVTVKIVGEESLKRYLGRVSELCDLFGMKLNASKTKIMIVSMVSRTRTMHNQSLPLTISGTAEGADDVGIMGKTYDYKMNFEKHIR